MRRVTPAFRRWVATVVTSLVVVLAGTSIASLWHSCVEVDAAGHHSVEPPEVQIVDRLTARIRDVLVAVPEGGACNRLRIETIRETGKTDETKTSFLSRLSDTIWSLSLAVVLFAAVGLVVLWWGRDLASLWLGAAMAALAPGFLPVYGFVPEFLALACTLVTGLLTAASIYAFFQMSQTVAAESLAPADRARRILRAVSACAGAVILLEASSGSAAILIDVAGGHSQWLHAADRVTTDLSWDVVFCALPVLYLMVAALRGTTHALRVRARIILAITAAGLSGVVFSLAAQQGDPQGAPFDAWWFSLLAIPVGFIIGILAFRVFDFKFLLTRVLIFAGLAIFVYLAFFVAEWLADPRIGSVTHIGPNEDFNRLAELVLGLLVATSFHRVEGILTKGIRHVVFRRREQGVRAVEAFTARSGGDAGDTNATIRFAVLLVRDALQTAGAAVYEYSGGACVLREGAGREAFPPEIRRDDPLFRVATGKDRPVSLDLAASETTALGTDGIAYLLAAGGQEIGMFVVRPHADPEDGDFDDREREAMRAVAQLLADMLLRSRMKALSGLLDALSAGTIAPADARERALALKDALRA